CPPPPAPLPAAALQRLVLLSHGHSQDCAFVPDLKAPGDSPLLVWECLAGHSFSWENPGGDSGAGRRRSLRRARPLGETEAEAPAAGGRREEPGGDGDNTTPVVPELGTTPKAPGSARDPEEKREGGNEAQGEEEEEEEEEDFVEDDDLTYSDDLRDGNYHPSLESDSEPRRRQIQPKTPTRPIKEEQPPEEPTLSSSSPAEEKVGGVSCRRRPPLPNEDVAQIGPKRIRKAAKRELLLCDFEGCGKIFSNRQYLNHHKKYQHVHQKTFTCSEPTCGKSFNFKKHLKEHEKLHSDTRDYICEFCARSFRTSSNLIIHRRIHTGEKPLQCEICGFTCRQKASLNWHMKKHSADTFYQFSCDICGKKFEKKDNVTAHKSKSHPQAPPGPPQLERGQLEMVPSPNLGLGLEHPEGVEPLGVPGLGEEALGSGEEEEEEEEEEKTPPDLGTSRESPGGSQGDKGGGLAGVES
ncbi:zinc finger protein 692-like, partial [Phaethornis superciliosus]